MELKFIPNGPRLAVEPHEAETIEERRMREVDLEIPDAYREKYTALPPTTGLVVAIGEVDFDIGDIVLFSRHAGTLITVQGRALLILEDKEVLGTLVEIQSPNEANSP